MIYWIAKHLAAHFSVLNVFSYLTLRSILAAMSALSIALLVGPFMIARLARYQIGQVVREDGPQSHLPKAGTPTMGGLNNDEAPNGRVATVTAGIGSTSSPNAPLPRPKTSTPSASSP